MTIKVGQHRWGKRNPDGSATCLKCGVFCPCNREVLDIDRFFVSEDCTVHGSMNTGRCTK